MSPKTIWVFKSNTITLGDAKTVIVKDGFTNIREEIIKSKLLSEVKKKEKKE